VRLRRVCEGERSDRRGPGMISQRCAPRPELNRERWKDEKGLTRFGVLHSVLPSPVRYHVSMINWHDSELPSPVRYHVSMINWHDSDICLDSRRHGSQRRRPRRGHLGFNRR
jgi:hypothetical protein